MDEDSIPSLAALSLQCVCGSVQGVCGGVQGVCGGVQGVCGSVQCVCGSVQGVCVRVCDGGVRFCWCPVFPQHLSDLLINTLAQEGVLNDETITVFRDTERLRLKRVCVGSCRLSVEAFTHTLCCHHLTELDASRLHGNLTVSDILQALVSSPQCAQSLQRLTLTGVQLTSSSSSGPGPSLSFGPGLSLSSGPGLSLSSGPGPSLSSGPGPSLSSGPGPSLSSGPGPSLSSGPGPSLSSGPGPSLSSGPGPSLSSGPGLSLSSGPGLSLSSGPGPSLSSGPGPSLSSGPGPSLSSGPGPSLSSGPGPSLSSGPGPSLSSGPDPSSSSGPGPSLSSGPDPSSSSLGALRSLRSLRSLGLAWTGLDDSGLLDVCSLPLLDSLDISGTAVTDLRPLLELSSHLRYLNIHSLHHLNTSSATLTSTLTSLDQLRHLDISTDQLDTFNPTPEVLVQLCESPDLLPVLESLDVSGWSEVSDELIKNLVKTRRMKFLGLLATRAGVSDFLSGEGDLKVAGECTLPQLCEALRCYRERDSFLQRALTCLSDLTRRTHTTPQPDILQLVCAGMKTHSESVSVNMEATKCILFLTDLELLMQMPLRLLGNVVHQLITTMKNFLHHEHILKTCQLILCRDYILDVVPFNRYEAVKVMMSLGECDDTTIQRISLSVIPILISKLSEEEIGQLGAEEFIIKKLLLMVQQRASVGAGVGAGVGVGDSTLNFSLSVLWNITDESPQACRIFLNHQGLELYTELLETYFFDSGVQQKVLGLLNNLAEVEGVCEQLMEEELLSYILTLIDSPEVEVKVRYFAGGILANLASRGERDWRLDTRLLDTVLNKLHSSVMSWTPPDHNMVTYKSLKGFYRLLHCSQPSGVQLWALWGLQLIIQHNSSLYSRMLLEDEEGAGLNTLKALTSDPDIHSDVQSQALKLLHLLETQHNCS